MLFVETVKSQNVDNDTIRVLLYRLSEYDGYVTDDIWQDVKKLKYKSNTAYLIHEALKEYSSAEIHNKKSIERVLRVFYDEILKHTIYPKGVDFCVKILANDLVVAVNYKE